MRRTLTKLPRFIPAPCDAGWFALARVSQLASLRFLSCLYPSLLLSRRVSMTSLSDRFTQPRLSCRLRRKCNEVGRLVTLMTLLAFGLIACGHSSSTAQPPPPSSNAASAALAYFFPASSRDWAQGQQFRSYLLTINQKSEAGCMTTVGFPAPPPQASGTGPNNQQFPDIPLLGTSGFGNNSGTPISPDPTAGMAPGEATAYSAALQKCAADPSNIAATITGSGRALSGAWLNGLSQVDATTQFQSALKDWVSCTKAAGVNVNTESGFFNYVDSKTVPAAQAGNTSASQSVGLHLAQVFSRCFGPAESIRDKLRAQAKTTFFNTHALQIRQIQTDRKFRH